MRVICINNKKLPPYNEDCPELIEGNEYNAFEVIGRPFEYDIENHLYDPKDGVRCGYLKSRFIPLSNIDETELRNINTKEEVGV